MGMGIREKSCQFYSSVLATSALQNCCYKNERLFAAMRTKDHLTEADRSICVYVYQLLSVSVKQSLILIGTNLQWICS